MPATFASIPEELVERILSLVLTQPSSPLAPRPSWHPYPSSHRGAAAQSLPSSQPHSSPKSYQPRLSPLLVSRTWLRISTPLYYRALTLHTPNQASSLASLLSANPELGKWVRSLTVDGTFSGAADVLRLCPNIDEFDLTVDNGTRSGNQADGVDHEVRSFCEGLSHINDLKHLVIRKNAYLTLPGPALIFSHLSQAVTRWQSLETVNIAFRFSPTSASSAFTSALAQAPRLRSVCAVLPAVWNGALLEISANPALKSITLQSPAPQQPYTPSPHSSYTPLPRTAYPRSTSLPLSSYASTTSITPSHLFLAEARKHPRLIELIRVGTPMVRARANTVGVAFPTVASRPQVQVQPVTDVESEPEAAIRPTTGSSDSLSAVPLALAGGESSKVNLAGGKKNKNRKGKRKQTNNGEGSSEGSRAGSNTRRLSAV